VASAVGSSEVVLAVLSAEPVELQRIAPENLIKIYFSVVKLF
jgi:hypothetical protein